MKTIVVSVLGGVAYGEFVPNGVDLKIFDLDGDDRISQLEEMSLLVATLRDQERDKNGAVNG